jgi:hypothetical protein
MDTAHICFVVERVKGIEPSYEAWEAAVLPLNYTRITRNFTAKSVEPRSHTRLHRVCRSQARRMRLEFPAHRMKLGKLPFYH